MSRLVREPLLWFLLAGAVLFLAAERFGNDYADTRIVVDEAERQRLANQWQAQMGRPPSAEELQGLVEAWVREEIYYREALALGLDANDTIIRRRLAQKLTFLSEDLGSGSPPDEDALQSFYEEHAARYSEPARFTFSHRYFSDHRPSAEADARAALARLLAGAGEGAADAAEVGDPFMLQRRYAGRSRQDIAELFGRDFATDLTALPPGQWSGPIRSAYGWHLVRLEDHSPPRQLAFAEVAERVAADHQEQRRRQANEAFFETLRARYEVVHR